MKRQTLQLGSALLATTALSSMATAGNIANESASTLGTTYNAVKLSAQVFGGTTAENITIGPERFAVNFSNQLTSTFDLTLDVSGAQITSTTGSLQIFTQSVGSGSLTASASFSGCNVQVLQDRIIVDTCLGSSLSRVDAIQFSNVTFNEANGLATAGNSVSLSGLVVGTTSRTTFETITAANIITSANSISGAVNAGTNLGISNTASPAFTKLTSNATSGSLGNAVVTLNPSIVGTNLGANLFSSQATSQVELTVTHGVLTDSATTKLTVSNSTFGTQVGSFVPTTTAGSVASFNVADGLTGTFDLEVQFNGTTVITEWAAGSADVAFTTVGVNLAGAPGATGALAALNRSGFSTELNTVQSTFGDGATLFQSFVRITNTGSVAGSANILVKNDNTGVTIGTFTTESIEAKSSLQVSMAQIEAVVGSPTANTQYRLEFTGPISGYVQHVMFNSVDNYFTELSGFRNGGATNP